MLKFLLLPVLISLVAADSAWARGGTMSVAIKGVAVETPSSWPAGAGAIVNDPSRTEGWRPYFSGWPNDVTHYGFEVKDMDDVNRLLRKLDATKSKGRQIRLSYQKEPTALGFVTRLPTGNGLACVFSIGERARADAMPPTFTIYVQNSLIDLAAIKIPSSIRVSAGAIAGTKVDLQKLDGVSRKSLNEIEALVDAHNKKAAQ